MKVIIFLLSISLFSNEAISQNSDCYKRLLQRGIEEFDKENYSQAILKWKTAKDNCPDVTVNEKKSLDNWIIKATEKQKTISVDTTKTLTNIKVIIKRDTLIKTVLKRDTLYVIKRDTTYIEKPFEKKVYVDRPVEKIVYVDKPVEKIVYRDRPEPYHPYGKGNCKILVYVICRQGSPTKVWIDGEYAGTFEGYYENHEPDCDNIYSVKKITLSGKHHIQTQDSYNRTTKTHITVNEDVCYRMAIGCN